MQRNTNKYITKTNNKKGSLMIPLMQISIPLSALFARIFRQKFLSRTHGIAIIVCIVGGIFGFMASYTGEMGNNYYNNMGNQINAFSFSFCVCVCFTFFLELGWLTMCNRGKHRNFAIEKKRLCGSNPWAPFRCVSTMHTIKPQKYCAFWQ